MNLPSPATDIGKMQGHMTELKRPQETTAQRATEPWPKIAAVIHRDAKTETKVRAFGALIHLRAKKPMSRPIIAPPQ